MTRQFLDMFFEGRWDAYAHFTLTALLIFIAALVMPAAFATLLGLTLMICLEGAQWYLEGRWQERDIRYNLYGAVFALLVLILLG